MKIFIVYNGNDKDGLKIVGKRRTKKRANALIYKEVRKKGYLPYYWRGWIDSKGREWTDYGSWSNFYIIEEKVI